MDHLFRILSPGYLTWPSSRKLARIKDGSFYLQSVMKDAEDNFARNFYSPRGDSCAGEEECPLSAAMPRR